ncbi:MAG: hypothetical protein ACRDJ4_16595 [Actinomycetota bacterium]
MMRSDRGQAGIALIIIIAWALTAVLMLTVTLVTAQQINTRVKDITNSVGGIKGETALVAILTETNQIASGILDAADQLSPKLDEVDKSAKSINSNASTILSSAQQINSTVNSGIAPQVKSILAEVKKIAGTVGAADGLGVADINERAATGDGIVRQIRSDTLSIRDDVASKATTGGTGIHYHLCSLLGSVLPGLALVPGTADGHC